MTDYFAPGTLRDLLTARTAAALRSGALQPISARQVYLTEQGIRFTVRILDTRGREALAAICRDLDSNPFLPYDPELFVAGASASHVVLLNKFPVVGHHLLVVTRSFEEQEARLTPGDFHALARCMGELNGLAFYNSGPAAGASQRHKHLQLVPLPPQAQGPAAPVETALQQARFDGMVGATPVLPFAHGLVRSNDPSAGGLQAAYERLRRHLRVTADVPHNLVITRDWMLLVPRLCQRCGSISVNALGFAGALLVRDEDELRYVEERGPLELLRSVALPPRNDQREAESCRRPAV